MVFKQDTFPPDWSPITSVLDLVFPAFWMDFLIAPWPLPSDNSLLAVLRSLVCLRCSLFAFLYLPLIINLSLDTVHLFWLLSRATLNAMTEESPQQFWVWINWDLKERSMWYQGIRVRHLSEVTGYSRLASQCIGKRKECALGASLPEDQERSLGGRVKWFQPRVRYSVFLAFGTTP